MSMPEFKKFIADNPDVIVKIKQEYTEFNQEFYKSEYADRRIDIDAVEQCYLGISKITKAEMITEDCIERLQALKNFILTDKVFNVSFGGKSYEKSQSKSTLFAVEVKQGQQVNKKIPTSMIHVLEVIDQAKMSNASESRDTICEVIQEAIKGHKTERMPKILGKLGIDAQASFLAIKQDIVEKIKDKKVDVDLLAELNNIQGSGQEQFIKAVQLLEKHFPDQYPNEYKMARMIKDSLIFSNLPHAEIDSSYDPALSHK